MSMNNMSCWSLKCTQIKRRLLILLLSPLPKGIFVNVSRHNFFVISRSRSKCKISVIHVSCRKKGKFTFTSKSSFSFHDVKKRLIHVHDMKKGQFTFHHGIHVHDMKKGKFIYKYIHRWKKRFTNFSLNCFIKDVKQLLWTFNNKWLYRW